MSTRPLRPCPVPQCPNLVARGRCATHQRQQDREHRLAKHGRYGRRHQRWRLRILARDPICRACRVAPSTVADHITPIRQGGAQFDESNGQGMCETCHNVKRSAESRA